MTDIHAALASLRKIDTPTVCNALEIVAPERRGHGYTTRPLVCARPELPPIVGFARTAKIAAMRPSRDSGAAARAKRLAYYRSIAEGPQPSIAVLQDLDAGHAGFGAFWGEVNSAIHKGLGCVGCVTDGSMRDLDMLAEGFQICAGSVSPSHAFVHVEELGGTVVVHGMQVSPGDLVHADRHGAVAFDPKLCAEILKAVDLLTRREAKILEAARAPDFDIEKLAKAMADAEEIH